MGKSLNGWRNQDAEHRIKPSNANTLAAKWTFTTGGDVSATPTVSDGVVYFPDWAGNLYALDASAGTVLWHHQISEYNNRQGSLARVSPAIHKSDLIIGDVVSATAPHAGANVMAVSRSKGSLRWITQVDSHPAAIITGSPIIANDIVYVGVSSNEENLASTIPSYPCCSFQGSVVALDANTGSILWKRLTLPDNHGQTTGYSGNAVWQPPAIDLSRGSLYVGTGNNYEVPDSVKTCISQTPSANQSSCFAADNYFDTALALDLKTGHVKWSRRLQGFDVWTVACLRNPNPVSCPYPDSPDYDLSGSGPNLFTNMVGFGQKSGIYWALNPDNGGIIWSSTVGPGATLGGIEWGTATDGNRIYIAITNSQHKSYPLVDGSTITSGAWSALDAATGHIIWQTADPDQGLDMGSVSLANGVLFAPSFTGKVHAIEAATGKILWSFQTGGSVIDGPSISKGMVFWGSGYGRVQGTPNNRMYAFTVQGRE